MLDNKKVKHHSRSLSPASAVLNFQHLKVPELKIQKEQKNITTLKLSTGQFFTPAKQF
jgi:hypothetical protein